MFPVNDIGFPVFRLSTGQELLLVFSDDIVGSPGMGTPDSSPCLGGRLAGDFLVLDRSGYPILVCDLDEDIPSADCLTRFRDVLEILHHPAVKWRDFLSLPTTNFFSGHASDETVSACL